MNNRDDPPVLSEAKDPAPNAHAFEVFIVFLRLGLSAFGGPIAHIGYFREAFVKRRAWLSDADFSSILALCHFLPGPASSQVGMAIGLRRAGLKGAMAAWLGFTLPSALLLVCAALALHILQAGTSATWLAGALQGLYVVAVVVVAQAVWGMMGSLCTSRLKYTLMACVCAVVLLVPGSLTQLITMVACACVGAYLFKSDQPDPPALIAQAKHAGRCWLWLVAFALLLVFFLAVKYLSIDDQPSAFNVVSAFYRTGAMVFGGGHVVLPLLQAELVDPQWLDAEAFLAGYGLTQAVPGPLFTFAAFVGASMALAVDSGAYLSACMWAGLCIGAIFLPSFLLVAGVLPLWQRWQHNVHAHAMMTGVQVGVVGLLAAALYDPLWTHAINSVYHAALLVFTGLLVFVWQRPPWLVVLLSAFIGAVFLPLT